jgi:hypothetical protein
MKNKSLYMILFLFATITNENSFAQARPQANTGATVSPVLQPPPAAISRRIIKTFDFNERPLGNLEDLPMNWTKITLSGFPHYVNGKIDDQQGSPPPSFRLELDGGNLGYLYTAREIAAFPGSNHKIVARFKTQDVHYSRGYIQAYYMDRYGNPLEDTMTYSSLIGPAGPKDPEWRTISMELPYTNPNGRFIAIGIFLVQQDRLPAIFDSPLKSYRKDLTAKLWIDQLTILRLPKTELKLKSNSPLYTSNDDIRICASVADAQTRDLSARIILTDLGYNVSQTIDQPVSVLPPLEAILQGTASAPKLMEYNLGKFPPGFYNLSLEILSNNKILMEKNIKIAVLNPLRNDDLTCDFGLDMSQDKFDRPEVLSGFIYTLSPRWIILPLWREDIPLPRGKVDTSICDKIIVDLSAKGIKILGAFMDVPQDLVAQTEIISPTIWDFLAGKRTWWDTEFAMILSRHTDRIDHWIFGRTRDCWQASDSRIKPDLAGLRTVFDQFQGEYSFIPAWPAMVACPTEPVADGYFLTVPSALSSKAFSAYFKPWQSANGGKNDLWTVLEGQDLEQFDLITSANDFAARFIEAKRDGIVSIGAQALWTRNNPLVAGGYEPNAYYPVYANLIDRLSGLGYIGEISIDDNRTGQIFQSDDRAMLVLQSTTPGDYISNVSIGNQLKAYDIWGRRIPVKQDDGQWQISYRPIVFVEGISSELARFLASIRLEPGLISSKFGYQQVSLVFRNTFNQAVNGTLKVRGPDYWEFDPSGSRFAFGADGKSSLPMKIRVPINESIGSKSIHAEFKIEARTPLTIRAILPLELGISNLVMRNIWIVRDGNLIVIQEIVNTGPNTTDLITYTVAPDQPRIERQIPSLPPGQTAIKEYSLGPWQEMIGKTIRVGFREVRGTRLANQIIKIE